MDRPEGAQTQAVISASSLTCNDLISGLFLALAHFNTGYTGTDYWFNGAMGNFC